MDTKIPAWTCMAVRAEAAWLETRAGLPVGAESWFVASSDALEKIGCSLAELFHRSRKAYPAMHEALDTAREGSGGELELRVRPMEMDQADVWGAGMGGAKEILERRAQVCGMRLVAAMNACAGAVAVHGMPMECHPGSNAPQLMRLLMEIGEMDRGGQGKPS